jgi:hypothetical protein
MPVPTPPKTLAVVAEHLDRLPRGDGRERERAARAVERCEVQVRTEALDDALRDEQQRADHRQRHEHVEQRPHEILPAVAEAELRPIGGPSRHDPADQGDEHDEPDGGRDEVLHRQAGHLAEVRHRRLAAVELPVRVRHERRDGVERDVPGPGVKPLGVELNGWIVCVRSTTYSSSQHAPENTISVPA